MAPMSDSLKQLGQAGEQVGITPEMIDAGVLVLSEFEGEVTKQTLVSLVFEAMSRVSPLMAGRTKAA
jgi:hypothetical protein